MGQVGYLGKYSTELRESLNFLVRKFNDSCLIAYDECRIICDIAAIIIAEKLSFKSYINDSYTDC